MKTRDILKDLRAAVKERALWLKRGGPSELRIQLWLLGKAILAESRRRRLPKPATLEAIHSGASRPFPDGTPLQPVCQPIEYNGDWILRSEYEAKIREALKELEEEKRAPGVWWGEAYSHRTRAIDILKNLIAEARKFL